jgi:preprotein translocase subunit SecY
MAKRKQTKRQTLIYKTLTQKTTDLSKRILFLLGALIVFRLGTHITIPFISPIALALLVQEQRACR